ncbi:MAG: hypothetical protein B7Z15_09150 [Rhizobiales bacterium 32-66-8]|nr:MAG: hypothetical protein B7Z15_09150 [Rhizobiales bacterium 32-66-8]
MPTPKPPHSTPPHASPSAGAASGTPRPADAAIDPRDFDVSEADIDEAIAACDGDSRATIRALLVAYAMLEREMSRRASAGYVRSRGAKT